MLEGRFWEEPAVSPPVSVTYLVLVCFFHQYEMGINHLKHSFLNYKVVPYKCRTLSHWQHFLSNISSKLQAKYYVTLNVTHSTHNLTSNCQMEFLWTWHWFIKHPQYLVSRTLRCSVSCWIMNILYFHIPAVLPWQWCLWWLESVV